MQTKTKPVIQMGEKMLINNEHLVCVEIQGDSAIMMGYNGNEYSFPLSEIARIKKEQENDKPLHSSTIYMTNIAFLMKAITKKDKNGKSYLDTNESNNKSFKEAVRLFTQGSEILTKAIMKADYGFMVAEQPLVMKDVVKVFDFMAALTEASMYVVRGKEWDKFQNDLSKTVNRHFGYQLLMEADDDKTTI